MIVLKKNTISSNFPISIKPHFFIRPKIIAAACFLKSTGFKIEENFWSKLLPWQGMQYNSCLLTEILKKSWGFLLLRQQRCEEWPWVTWWGLPSKTSPSSFLLHPPLVWFACCQKPGRDVNWVVLPSGDVHSQHQQWVVAQTPVRQDWTALPSWHLWPAIRWAATAPAGSLMDRPGSALWGKKIKSHS